MKIADLKVDDLKQKLIDEYRRSKLLNEEI